MDVEKRLKDKADGKMMRLKTHHDNFDELTPDDALIISGIVATGGNIQEAFRRYPLPIGRKGFYKRPREWRERILALADRFILAQAEHGIDLMSAGVGKAVLTKLAGMDSPRWRERQDCASEILDRVLGKPPQTVQVGVKGGRFAMLIAEWQDMLPNVEQDEDGKIIEGEAREVPQ